MSHLSYVVSIEGSLRDREVACSASDRQGSNFESCVWRTVSSKSSHHPQEVLLAQFSLYVHKGGLKPDSIHFLPIPCNVAMMAAPDNPTIAIKSPAIPLCCGGTSVTALFRTGEVMIIGVDLSISDFLKFTNRTKITVSSQTTQTT